METPEAGTRPVSRNRDAPPRIVRGTRPGIDWNTCGQAAIATLLAYAGLGPFANAAAPEDGAAIDAVARHFPPDMPLGLGTTAWRIAAALRAHGLDATHVHGGWFGVHAGDVLARVAAHADAGRPVPVCVSARALGPAPHGSAHWAIVLGVRDGHVQLGNAGIAEMPVERFIAAWRCRWLPYGHNAAAILAR